MSVGDFSGYSNYHEYFDWNKRLCIRELERLAIVEVKIGPNYVNQMTKSLRVTFSGQLANFGEKN